MGGGAGGWLAILMRAISRLTSGSNAANAPFFRAASWRSKIEPRASACKGSEGGLELVANDQMKLIDPGSAEDADLLLDRFDLQVGDVWAGIGDQDQHAAGIFPERLASGDRQRIETALRDVAPTESDQVGADFFPKNAVILGKDLSTDEEQLRCEVERLGSDDPEHVRRGRAPAMGRSWGRFLGRYHHQVVAKPRETDPNVQLALL